jgi:hypothetical protein
LLGLLVGDAGLFCDFWEFVGVFKTIFTAPIYWIENEKCQGKFNKFMMR